ncbi:hypothetical protein EC968_007595, partial [Mortierella alpina]
HSEDESELPEDDGSHEEEGDEEDEDGEEAEDDEEDDDDGQSVTHEVSKAAPPSFPQKPTLNRPQLIAEEEKDSGDDLSDLSEFDDTDDSDDDEHDGRDTTAATSTRSSRAKAEAASIAGAGTASRPSLGGRKRSLRENSRETKGGDEKMKREVEEENDEDYDDPRARHSDKETESEVAEDEDREEDEEAKVEDEDEEAEEEEDLEKKRVHMDAMEALTTIEVDFANLRDKMYEERMLELDKEVEMINAGTHPELSTLMREIEDKREQRLRVAKAWRTHTGEIAQCEFEIKEYQAHCTYQSKKREYRTDLVQELGRKRRRLILELNLSSDRVVPDKVALVRARKQRRAAANELRAIKEQYGFPTSKMLPTATNTELADDFEAMGLPRPTSQPNMTQHGSRSSLGYEQSNVYMPQAASSPRPKGRFNWPGPAEYSPVSGPRTEVEIYVEGSRSNIDGIWYKPNDPVAVLDAALGQYNAKYLHVANDEVDAFSVMTYNLLSDSVACTNLGRRKYAFFTPDPTDWISRSNLLLQEIEGNEKRYVCIGTTHLVYGGSKNFIKLGQALALTAAAEALIKRNPSMPFSFADLSMAEERRLSKPVASWMQKRVCEWDLEKIAIFKRQTRHLRIRRAFSPLLPTKGDALRDAIRNLLDTKDGVIQHSLRLSSVYNTMDTVDYIFYGQPKGSKALLEPVARLKIYEAFLVHGAGLPAAQFGSDHYALGVQFRFA